MITAATARENAYKSVGQSCHADAINKLYDGIDARIEAASKSGKMSIDFFIDEIINKYIGGVGLSGDQMITLGNQIKTKYEKLGFKVQCIRYNYTKDITIEIGWFLL